MKSEFEGKKLLILGGNPETIPLVEIANNWGIKTIVASARDTDPAKDYAWKSYTYEGLDTGAVIKLATEEKVEMDGKCSHAPSFFVLSCAFSAR